MNERSETLFHLFLISYPGISPSVLVAASHADCSSVVVGNAVLSELREKFSSQLKIANGLSSMDFRRPFTKDFAAFTEKLSSAGREVVEVKAISLSDISLFLNDSPIWLHQEKTNREKETEKFLMYQTFHRLCNNVPVCVM